MRAFLADYVQSERTTADDLTMAGIAKGYDEARRASMAASTDRGGWHVVSKEFGRLRVVLHVPDEADASDAATLRRIVDALERNPTGDPMNDIG